MWGYGYAVSLTLGRYELLRQLGQGGMAEVFLARRRGPGGVEKRLAIKRIRRERASDPRWLGMFVDEARLSMAMVHKNIVPMFDFGRAGDELFLVMEYVDGADLNAALAGARTLSRPMEPEVAAFIAMEACQALDYAHTMSGPANPARVVVHSDVNPRNVLLSYAGEVKLVDFGVATTETDLGRVGKVRGTPAYMAPEQARAESVDERADVFSLGLVLWESLSGRRAYGEDSVEHTLAVARRAEVPPLPDSVPDRLAKIVARATARDREHRYASARQMQLDLDEYIVAARAAGKGGAPLAHRLSTWLRRVCPPQTRTAERPVDIETPAGQVVTYLDDGELEVERVITDSKGTATLRSLALTMADGEPGGEPEEDDAAADSAAESAPDTTARHRLLPRLAGAMLAVAALLIVISWTRGSATESPAEAGAAPGRIEVPTAEDSQPRRAPESAPTPLGKRPEPPGRAARARDDGTPTVAAEKKSASSAPHERLAHRSHEEKPKTHAPVETGARPAPGTVRVSASPWATVVVEGERAHCAETPCELSLPPGPHKLLLRNPPSALEKTVAVKVVSGQTTDVIENLTR